jgi:hypothetical protein
MPATAIDPHPDGGTFEPRHGIGHNCQAIGKFRDFNIHEGNMSWKMLTSPPCLKALCRTAASGPKSPILSKNWKAFGGRSLLDAIRGIRDYRFSIVKVMELHV